MNKGEHGINSQMIENIDNNIKGLDMEKGEVGEIVTGKPPKKKPSGSKLPAQKATDKRVKSGLWIDFKRVKLDGRTALAKMMNLIKREMVKHVGGEPSIAQAILIERVVHKAIKAYIYETNFFSNPNQGSKDHYLALVNSLRLDLTALGLEKRVKKILDLTEYLNQKEKKNGFKGIE